jgi:Uma2 family endonuclease
MSYTLGINCVVPSEDDMATAESQIRYTREEYVRMAEAGVFGDRRVELIDGVIYEKMSPQKSPHASGVRRGRRALQAIFSSEEFDVDAQLPLDLSEYDMPEPDLAVVPRDPKDYADSHPTGALLVLEVTDTSQYHDRKRKVRTYAEARIQDYWIVNIPRDVLEVYRDPVDGVYRTRRTLRRGEQIAPLARPEAWIAVDDLLPTRG